MTNYRFCGNGAGVPGLPFEVSDDEAAEQGVSELLKAAIANGNYVEVKAAPKAVKPAAAKVSAKDEQP
jgi:hypothetical protein